MYKVLDDRERIEAIQVKLENTFNEDDNTDFYNAVVGFPSGSVHAEVGYDAARKFWFLFGDARRQGEEINRFWNAFGLQNPRETNTNLHITCEINVPIEGINRRIAAAFAEDKLGRQVIVHRGKVRCGQKGVGKRAFLDFYQGKTIKVQDGDKVSELLLVCDLNSDDVIGQIKAFVASVMRFKNIYSKY